MNAKLYSRLVEFARALKTKKQSGEKHHVAFLLKKSRVICVGWNNYNKSHNVRRFGKFVSHKFTHDVYRPCVHAEISAITRWGQEDLRGYDMAVIRIDNNDNANMSKPCINCGRILDAMGVRKIFYSDKNGECQEIGAEGEKEISSRDCLDLGN